MQYKSNIITKYIGFVFAKNTTKPQQEPWFFVAVYSEKILQGGSLPVINGVITAKNGTINR